MEQYKALLKRFHPLTEDERLDIEGGRKVKDRSRRSSKRSSKTKRRSSRSAPRATRKKKSKKREMVGSYTPTGEKSRKEGRLRTDHVDRRRQDTLNKAYRSYYERRRSRSRGGRLTDRYALQIIRSFNAGNEWGNAYGAGNYCDDNLERQLNILGRNPSDYLPLGTGATVEQNWKALTSRRGGTANQLLNNINESGTYVFYAINGGGSHTEDHTGTVTVDFATNTFTVIHSGSRGDGTDQAGTFMVQRTGTDPTRFLASFRTVQYMRI